MKKRDSAIAGPVAISIRQPWATLIVHGLKRIEIRRWSTPRVGRIYIHAGKMPDKRAHAWKLVPKHLQQFTTLTGGIIGQAHLVECRKYPDRESFEREKNLHFNEPEWFLAPKMFGFVFDKATPLPFREVKGKLYFFAVDAE